MAPEEALDLVGLHERLDISRRSYLQNNNVAIARAVASPGVAVR
jgi:hypothetical protein